MKLSIVIAAYNVEKYIERCIISCATQNININEYEIIVINDGSTDNTQQIVDNLSLKIKNLRVFHRTNHGLGATRNFGIQQSKGEYLWFVDGDDFIEKNILKKIIHKINKNHLDALVLNYSIVDSNYTLIQKNANNITNISSDIFSGIDFYYSNFKKSYSVLFIIKRFIFINYKLTFKQRINMQDSEILPKILINCKRMSFLQEIGYYYVQDPNSFTNTQNCKKRHEYFKSIIEVKKSLENFAQTIKNTHSIMYQAVLNKINSLDEVIFSHLVYFKYDKKCLHKIIQLLRQNKLFPLKNKINGKMLLVKKCLNLCPRTTKIIIDLIR